jgi:hypothetical protein
LRKNCTKIASENFIVGVIAEEIHTVKIGGKLSQVSDRNAA